MNRVLRSGLWILGVGSLSVIAAAFGGPWGPCGPGSLWAMLFFLAALVAIPPGVVLLLIGLIIQLRQWISQRMHPQSS